MAFLIPENLRNRRDVAPGVARLARAVQEGLDDAATVWFEPLFDGQGDRPDLVVLVPDAGILVIEVLETKANAIRGVRDGRLLVDKRGEQREVPTPLARAAEFASRLSGRISGSRIPPDERLPVRAVGAFPYLTGEEAVAKGIAGAVPLDRCVLREHLDVGLASSDEFRRLVAAFLRAPMRDPLSPDAEKAHRALIHPDTVIGSPQLPFATVDTGGGGDDLKVLDRRQEALAKNLGEGHRVIRGVAGSGKTLVLTYRARLLARHFPHHRILVTCYNRSLAGVLSRQLPQPNVTVATLDRLMDKARRRAGLEVEDFKKYTPEQLAQRALDGLDAHPDAVGRFDHVLVDEAQDFSTPALAFAVRLIRPGSDSLLVVADSAQNIYRSTFTWKAAGINALGRTRKLDTSYRNTREILEYAHHFVVGRTDSSTKPADDPDDEMAILLPRFSTRSGPLPHFLLLPSPQGEVAAIADHCRQLLDRGVPAGDNAVLYGTRNAGGFDWPGQVQSVFAARAIPVFWATDPDRRENRDHIGEDASKVVLSTIHSAKGLEFRHVVLCGYLSDDRPDNAIDNRKLIYVGMTRATHELTLTASGRHPYIADLDTEHAPMSHPRAAGARWQSARPTPDQRQPQ